MVFKKWEAAHGGGRGVSTAREDCRDTCGDDRGGQGVCGMGTGTVRKPAPGRQNTLEYMKIGCINVRGWGLGKCEDVCCELNSWNMDLVGVTETHLRENVRWDNGTYEVFFKGRKKQATQGGGVAMVTWREECLEVEELDVGAHEMSEDIMAVKVEYTEVSGIRECVIVVLCYMTTQGVRAARENEIKYGIVKRIVRENMNGRVIVMGDMNGRIRLLDEPVNENGERLNEFVYEMNLENLNVTIAEGCVTWSARGQKFAIDYVLVNERARVNVNKMWIDEDGEFDIATDHTMIVIEWRRNGRTRVGRNKRNGGAWKIRYADWVGFQNELVSTEWLEVDDVNKMNEQLIEGVRSAAYKKIGCISKQGWRGKNRNKWWNEQLSKSKRKKKQINRRCKKLKKRCNEGEQYEGEYQEAWAEYLEQKRKFKCLIRQSMVEYERREIEKIREKNQEGGREWYRFLGGAGNVAQDNGVDRLRINGKYVNYEQQIVNKIKRFWKEIGGMNE